MWQFQWELMEMLVHCASPWLHVMWTAVSGIQGARRVGAHMQDCLTLGQ